MIDESALLSGGPADGVRVSVPGRPKVLQVVHPCEPGGEDGLRVQALYVYRKDGGGSGDMPLRYTFDPASP